MTGDLPDRVKQAIPVAVVVHAVRMLAVFDREALRDFSRALFYSDAQNPVDTGGRRPSPREEPATAVLHAVLTESKFGFRLEQGPVVATDALPNNLIVAAVWMAWSEADWVHGGLSPLPDEVTLLLCRAVAVHREGVSLRRAHPKWRREVKRVRSKEESPSSSTDEQKGIWLGLCQRVAVALGWRESTTVAGYEKAVRSMLKVSM